MTCGSYQATWQPFLKRFVYSVLAGDSLVSEVFDLYAMYCIGWFYNEDRTVDYNKSPIEFKKHPLGETASSMLGIPYREIKPKVNNARRAAEH